jgi:phenylacetate-coenzyme A ligase PaaK-like adenylate-forming protein
MPRLTPLEPWIASRIGLPAGARLTRSALERYQLDRLHETLAYAREQSPFYRRQLAGSGTPASLGEMATLPFTTPDQIREDDRRFLCVSAGEIERVVTLHSSGTTAPPKRLHFTAHDLELTVDFFHHGMGTMVRPGQRVLILMPGELPGSVGDLLAKGLQRLGVTGIIHGLVRDNEATLRRIAEEKIDCLVGLPVQLLGLTRHPAARRLCPNRLTSILVSADYAPQPVRDALSTFWGVPVYDHYGMTEMGLGGAVECAALYGYHPREADLYLEIVDPLTGVPLPDGQPGEVVFTTLTRRGMPLVRYRTGDLARYLPEPCPCGSVLRRLERVRGRMAATLTLANGGQLNITQLDETLFLLPFLLNYQAVLSLEEDGERLSIGIETGSGNSAGFASQVQDALLALPAIAEAVAAGVLTLDTTGTGRYAPSPTIKRAIIDTRQGSGP